MRFMMLVKGNKEFEAGVLPDKKFLTEMKHYNDELARAGALLAAEGLHPTSKGWRTASANGRITVTDGPFTEAKEIVAGFWLIQAKSRDEAIEWAKRAPFQGGEVEIRPLMEVFDFPVDTVERLGGRDAKDEQPRGVPPPSRNPGAVRYVGFVMADTETETGKLPDATMIADMETFLNEGARAGVFLSGEGLLASSNGARVRYSGNKRVVTDGPFAEAKELVAGFTMLQFTSTPEAIEWSKRFVQVDAPGRLNGESVCEMRPIFEPEEFAARK